VADPAFMRRNHMDLLKHQRNETVHLGVRDARASLKGCIECHASKATGSVAAAKTDFCISCHSYAAVKVDCFECHSSKRQTVGLAAPLDALQSTTVIARLAAQWREWTEGGR
jgi:formate-dependent nitrite reductase cytochrome c552 subunit